MLSLIWESACPLLGSSYICTVAVFFCATVSLRPAGRTVDHVNLALLELIQLIGASFRF